jgi:hypothetical protein
MQKAKIFKAVTNIHKSHTILFDVSSFDTKITFKLSSPDFVSHNDSRLLFPTKINIFLVFYFSLPYRVAKSGFGPGKRMSGPLPLATRADQLKLSVARET